MSNAIIYAIGWQRQGPIKIGFAANILKRLDGLQTGSPYRLRVWFGAVVPAEKAVDLEVAAHNILLADQMIGEWFDVAAHEARAAIVKGIEGSGEVVTKWQPSPKMIANRKRQAIRHLIRPPGYLAAVINSDPFLKATCGHLV